MEGTTVVAAARVITDTSDLSPGWVRWREGRILEVGEGRVPVARDGGEVLDGVLVPGFVDLHCHGGGGADVSGEGEGARQVLASHRRQGTTTTMASLATAAFADLERQVAGLAPLVERGELAGLHLEGPWLQPRRRGAHPLEHLATPTAADVQRLISAGAGAVRMVTLAPELPGALDVIPLLVDHGVTVAIGHTEASYEQTRAAIQRGATWATHLGNAMAPLLHREPGPALALLEDERVTVELIVDGHHLHPAVARSVLSAASGRAVLVSDAMAAAGAPDGSYALAGQPVQVEAGVARLADGTLAGSTLTSVAAVRSAVAAGVPLPAAVRAASSVPARRFGLTGVGDLAAGQRADLVLLDGDLQVAAVWQAGHTIALGGASRV